MYSEYGYFKSKDELTKVPAGSVNQQLVLAHGTSYQSQTFIGICESLKHEFFETYEK